MALNKQKGNMYSWVTHTWNPIRGKCPHDCSYCYMKRFPQKELRLDDKCFNDLLGDNKFIFVGSSCDMFAEVIPDLWIEKVFNYIKMFEGNDYLLQTKNPSRLTNYNIPPYVMVGTTIESNRDYKVGNAPLPCDRVNDLIIVDACHKMVSIEPVLDFDVDVMVEWIRDIDPEFVSIGADSKNNGLPEPSKEKINNLIEKLSFIKQIKTKKNLNRLMKNSG